MTKVLDSQMREEIRQLIREEMEADMRTDLMWHMHPDVEGAMAMRKKMHTLVQQHGPGWRDLIELDNA